MFASLLSPFKNRNRVYPVSSNTVKTILVVDDDENIRELTDFWLKAAGYSGILCKNGSEAIDRLKTNKEIALIILDVQMPVMNGNEVLNEMRVGGYLDSIPVLIVSANSDASANHDASEILIKPVTEERLLATVKKCVENRPTLSA